MKSRFCFLILCSLFSSCLLTGCFKKADSSQVIHLKVADIHPEGYPTVTALHEFSNMVRERTRDRIQIEVCSGGSEGDEASTVEKVQFGKLDFARVSISPLSVYDSNLEIISLPGEFKNELHFWKVLDGEIGQELLAGLQNHGFYGLCFYEAGARSFYTTKRIYSLNDLKGKKIRVQQSPVMMEYIKAIGAVPVPMGFEEILPALSKGFLDGAENNIPSYNVAGHYNAAPYFYSDEHSRLAEVLIGSRRSLSFLSEQDLKIIFEAARDSEAVQKLAWQDYEQKAKAKLHKQGVVFITPDKSDRDAKIQMVQPVLNKRFNAEQKAIIEQIGQIH